MTKTVTYEGLEIENFMEWYARLHKTHPDLLGATWDKEKKLLSVFYQDGATELSEDELKTLKIPTILRFREEGLAAETGCRNRSLRHRERVYRRDVRHRNRTRGSQTETNRI